MSASIPVPVTLLEATWLIIGVLFARSFGKRFDQQVQASQWFKGLTPFWKWFFKSLLNFTHHFWIGLLLMVYLSAYPEIYWFGVGIFLDDLPDIPKRARKYLQMISLTS